MLLLAPIFAPVSAAVSFMRRLVKRWLSAVMVSGVVSSADVSHGDFVRGSHVAQGVNLMPDCHSCKQDRKNKGQAARALHRLPSEVTQSKEFKRKGLPVSVCVHCDGDVYERALSSHKGRTQKADK